MTPLSTLQSFGWKFAKAKNDSILSIAPTTALGKKQSFDIDWKKTI